MNEQEHIIETFSEMATRYEKLMNSELSRFWGINYHGFIHEVLGDIETNDSTKILDIATGTAFIPRNLVEKKTRFEQIIGLDLTFNMLENGKKLLGHKGKSNDIAFICASAHSMPFAADSFDLAICCLATHHMNVDQLLSEMYFAIKPGSTIHIGDVGGSARWKIGLIRTVIKFFAFFYFLFTENYSRARAESSAVANVLTSEEWKSKIVDKGFEKIRIREVPSSRFWTPNPVIIEATKKMED